jgi:hypothetical protein
MPKSSCRRISKGWKDAYTPDEIKLSPGKIKKFQPNVKA